MNEKESKLKKAVKDGFLRKVNCGEIVFTHKNTKRAYINRYNTEIEEIEAAGLDEFILVIADVVAYTKKTNLAIAPQSTIAGSLVAYLLGISEIDSIKYELLFERFLNSKNHRNNNENEIELSIAINVNGERIDEIREYIKTNHNDLLQVESIEYKGKLHKYLYKGCARLCWACLDEQRCLETLEHEVQKDNPSFRYINIPLDDDQVFEMLGSDDVEILFRWSHIHKRDMLFKELLHFTKPKTIENLALLWALAAYEGMESLWFDHKLQESLSCQEANPNDKNSKKFDAANYEIYQEQVISVISDIFGCSLKEAETLWDYLRQKKDFQIDEKINRYIQFLLLKGDNKMEAMYRLYSLWKKSNRSLSKSHSLLTCLTFYRLAYFRCYYHELFDCVCRSIYGENV